MVFAGHFAMWRVGKVGLVVDLQAGSSDVGWECVRCGRSTGS